MINIIWGILLVIGIVFSLLTGNIGKINLEILSSSRLALDLILQMLPILVLWMGLMKIAEDSGLLQKIANFFTPFLGRLFPSIPKGNKAIGYIASNMAVNMAGLGSAATPFGLKAMDELQKINNKKDTASEAMKTFIILNTACVTLIPTTIISLRMMYESNNPSEVIPTILIATAVAFGFGIMLDWLLRKRRKK